MCENSTDHTPECDDYSLFYHAATGGDADCTCSFTPAERIMLYDAVFAGDLAMRDASEDDALLRAAEELGIDLRGE